MQHIGGVIEAFVYGLLEESKILKDKNLLFGVGNEEDNKETINYAQFGNLVYQNNNSNNLLYVPYVNNYYYYIMNNNGTQQNGIVHHKCLLLYKKFILLSVLDLCNSF